MSQIVQDWMSSSLVVVPPEISAAQAMGLMRRRGIRSLVIDLSGRTGTRYGIVTVTDIRDDIATQGRNSGNIAISEIMSAPIECSKPEWSLRQAALKMQEIGVNHLPVEDRRGSLIGMISVTDIFMAVEEAGWSSGPQLLESITPLAKDHSDVPQQP